MSCPCATTPNCGPGVDQLEHQLVHTFSQVEAVRGSYTPLANPITLAVTVRRVADSHTVETPTPYVLADGIWGVMLTPTKYQPGVSYQISWTYQMILGVDRVDHEAFTWDPPRIGIAPPGHCLVFGRVTDPLHVRRVDEPVLAETFSDIVALSRRTSALSITPNVFGVWRVSLPYGRVVRLSCSGGHKVISVPHQQAANAGALPVWQPKPSKPSGKYGP